MFIKYPHLERFGTDEVDGINVGVCHIFPKIDGTNASFWVDSDADTFNCGSRNRQLDLENDNAGFMAWATQQEPLVKLAKAYPDHRFFGEWLVPHSLKTYRDEAWRNLYIFDVLRPDGSFMHYDEYSAILNDHGVAYIPCMLLSRNPTYEILLKATENNTYLLRDGAGNGEGIVVKQYGWENRFGRPTWAKLITNQFREKHVQEMGGAVANAKLVEEAIAEEYVTSHLVEKIIAKIRNDSGAFSARNIPQLLSTTFHDLVTEEMWEAVKKHKNPKVCFRTLNTCTIQQVKRLKPELFGLPT